MSMSSPRFNLSSSRFGVHTSATSRVSEMNQNSRTYTTNNIMNSYSIIKALRVRPWNWIRIPASWKPL